MPRLVLMEQLEIRYAEVPVAMGLQSNGIMVEIFASRRENTWSIVITEPNGASCLISAGENWENLLPQAPDSH